MRRDPKLDALDVMASSKGAKIAGGQTGSFTLYETLDHGADLMPLLAGTQSWPDAVTAWRKAGGAVRPDRRAATAIDAVTIDPLLASLY
jgi:hypothetical protein